MLKAKSEDLFLASKHNSERDAIQFLTFVNAKAEKKIKFDSSRGA